MRENTWAVMVLPAIMLIVVAFSFTWSCGTAVGHEDMIRYECEQKCGKGLGLVDTSKFWQTWKCVCTTLEVK